MTVPAAVSRPGRIPPARRLAARVAVGLARLFARLPPRRLHGLLTVLRHGATPATYSAAKQARDAVLAVSLTCLRTNGCLPRSVATAVLCRMSGTWPTWCTGPRRYPPMSAHAWVEAEDRMVDEPYPHDYFARLLTVPPLDKR